MEVQNNHLAHAAFEQLAIEEVPRLLGEWFGGDPREQPVYVERLLSAKRADMVVLISNFRFVVEIRKVNSLPSIDSAANRVREAAKHELERRENEAVIPLVVVPYMTESGSGLCKQQDVSWLDLSGNAMIDYVGQDSVAHVRIAGMPNRFPTRRAIKNLFSGKAARITRHMLSNPNKSFSQSEIARAADLDPGYVSRLVRQMVDLDLIVRDQNGVRPTDSVLLLQTWREQNNAKHAEILAHLPASSGEDRTRILANIFEQAGVQCAATGLAAAWAYTRAAGFKRASIYVQPKESGPLPFSALEEVGFRRQTNAPNVRILIPDDLGVFAGARSVEGFMCVSPVQAYADLKHEYERADEFAAALLSKAVGEATPQWS